MTSNQPTVENLHEIKNTLEQKMNESSDSEYISSSTSFSSSSRCSRSSNKKLNKTINYKLKYNNLESKIRYMQLEMVNKEIELSELQNKLCNYSKIDMIFTKINFLFERLDNAYKILNERINLSNDNDFIKLKTVADLTTNKDTLKKVMSKYALYINNELYPLINTSDIYFKNSITALYEIKQKELSKLSNLIDIKIYDTKCYNTMWLSFFVLISVIFIQIIIISICYLIGYF
jgi:hypothetical protein